MSFIVKGMDMPRCCLECPMFAGNGCKALMILFWDGFNVASRAKNCPLINLDRRERHLFDCCPHCGAKMDGEDN